MNAPRAPQADWRQEDLDAYNTAAAEWAGVTAAEVCAAAREHGPPAVELLKTLGLASLARTQTMAFAGGPR